MKDKKQSEALRRKNLIVALVLGFIALLALLYPFFYLPEILSKYSGILK